MLKALAKNGSLGTAALMRRGHGNGDIDRLVRMGFATEDGQTYNRSTGYAETTYTITPKGQAASGVTAQSKPQGISPGRVARIGEAYQNDPNSSDDEAREQNAQQAPTGAPPAAPAVPGAPIAPAAPAAPQTPARPTQPVAAPSPTQGQPAMPAPAAQPATPPSQPQPTTPTASQTPAPAPSPADVAAAKQVADKLKANPNQNPATLDSDIQKSVVAMNKPTQQAANMTNLIKQQMGVTESTRAARGKGK